MDKIKRMERMTSRLLERLAYAGPDGLRRSKLIADVANHDYRFGAETLEANLANGCVETVDGFVRLTLAGVDELAFRGMSSRVDIWLDLDLESGERFRNLRLELTGGRDIALHPGAQGQRPIYRCAQGVLNDRAYRLLHDALPESESFWFASEETIPAGKPSLVLVPDPVSGDLTEIEVPAQAFEWTPQVHTTGPHNVAVMALPDVSVVDVDAPEFDELLDEPRASESFWA